MTRYPMYKPSTEHESCGVGAVVDLDGGESHQIVSDALTIVERLAHRAGCDALGTTGDGVGILTQIPHGLFSRWSKAAGIDLGEKRDYGVAMLFMPLEEERAAEVRHVLESAAKEEGLRVLGWRDVPCRPEILGEGARRTMPGIAQCFLARPQDAARGLEFDRRLFVLRRSFEKRETGTYV